MRAEIIALGDEITSGQLLDANSRWLSQRLEELGVRVFYHTTVGDELEPMAEVFRQAVRPADVVVATGGLGPTADDLTREAIAEAAGPAHVFALPGVPAEMEEMWHETVADAIRRAGGGRRVVRRRVIKCFGAGESNVEAMLPDLIRRGRTPRVGINASQATILLRIAAEGNTDEECRATLEPTVATIRQCLGTLVFGEGDDELQDAVLRLLKRHQKTLATVECGTAGLVADWLGASSESPGHFLGGIVVANERALGRILDVPGELIARHTAPSAEVARAMAQSCRRRFAADYGLAIGRFPRFDPAAAAPEPMFVALAHEAGVDVKPFPFAGHPALLRVFSAKRALNLVRLAMLARDEG